MDLFNTAQLYGYDESYLPLLPLVHSCMISMYWAIANIPLICIWSICISNNMGKRDLPDIHT